jgi:ssRNA-specific RNase YbeY (16S rRNA maturation enzyme)
MASAKQDQEIIVHIARDFKDIEVRLPELRKLVKAICNRFKLSKATVSIAIVDDAQIRELNKQFLNSKSATDCLSFDLSDDKGPQSPKLFELIVNGEMACCTTLDSTIPQRARHGKCTIWRMKFYNNSATVWYIIRAQEHKSTGA